MATRTASFRSSNQDLEAYLAHLEGEGPFPGVVVIYEGFSQRMHCQNL